MLTFSCRRCLSSFSSRYVRFDRTGVLKGFIIFLMATAWLVSWSLAELRADQCAPRSCGMQTYQTRPKAPMPTGCRSVYLCDVSPTSVPMWGMVAAPACDLERRAENLGAHEFSHGGGRA
jgi:hypothetical protein